MTDSESRTTLAAAGEAHALKIGGYGVHCACGYYFEGFGPNPRNQRSCVRDYGWADETLFEHVARSLPAGVGGDREALDGYEAIYAAIEPISGYEAKTPDGQRRLVDRLLAGLDNPAARETLRAWLDGTDEQGRFPNG